MTADRGVELATDARAKVARVVALLERPDVETLDQSSAELAAAVALIEQIWQENAKGGALLKSSLGDLRSDLRSVRSLLRQAWEFRVCPGGQPGYTGKGELALQPPSRGRLALEA